MGSIQTEIIEVRTSLEQPIVLKSLIPKDSAPKLQNVGFGMSNFSKYVVFCIGREKEKLYGLKTKLVAKSPIFYEIVYARKEINHPEFRPAVFREFLKFINTDDFYIEEDHVPDLLRLAFLYEIPQITWKCLEFAKHTLNLNNCVKYHLAATLYELTELQTIAFQFMLSQGQAFLTHPSFLDLDPLTLGAIIGRDDFNVIETDLFRCIMAWIEAECKRINYPADRKEFHRRVCGNLFQNIRYSLMTPREFNNIVIPTGILTPDDIEEVVLRHTTHPNLWHTLPKSKHLDRHRRSRQRIQIPLYGTAQFGYHRTGSPNIKGSIRFLVSRNISLTGIEFLGPAQHGSGSPLTSFKIKYQIENEFMSQYGKMLPETTSVVTDSDFEVKFLHPYRIEGQQSYKVNVWIEGQMTQFGFNPVPQAIVFVDQTFISFLFSNGPANKSKSSLEMDSLVKSIKIQPEFPGVIKSLMFETL